jgi:NAD(P)-dependent dehydrogenase (short-subunit alcohol dehydrogenase family)
MTRVEFDFGHLDVLVNNAGICIEEPIVKPAKKTGIGSWRST